MDKGRNLGDILSKPELNHQLIYLVTLLESILRMLTPSRLFAKGERPSVHKLARAHAEKFSAHATVLLAIERRNAEVHAKGTRPTPDEMRESIRCLVRAIEELSLYLPKSVAGEILNHQMPQPFADWDTSKEAMLQRLRANMHREAEQRDP